MRRPAQSSKSPGGKTKLSPAALGFRAHSGWAAMVAVAGPMESPKVIRRRRIELAYAKISSPVQPYHAAQEMELKPAEAYIGKFAEEARDFATQAVRTEVQELQKEGYQVVGCGLVTGSGRPTPTVEAALASHPMLHTAEGELFRNAIICAAERNHLPVHGVREKDALARGAKKLNLSVDRLHSNLSELGRSMGPPWGQDQKLATLVAWLTLAGLAKS